MAETVTLAGAHSFTPPRLLEPVVPFAYPEQRRRDGIEGQVTIWLTIDPTGTVIAVSPATPSPDRDFYESAKRAALAQRWRPAEHDGKPVFTILQSTYRFRLGP